ncbi:hypothetical protein A1OE_78 [Candidatus Endolissoclinum faulkneri L2]|uniref:Uncharacterized protein n=1 Tax=Candidatus Endolissoclinum faulkneri L2 TaxID=1193729 RepID=K7YLC4_9PROT|nr:hypothetical protein A1OE_78 [Candidatus Endolissoclinum faulkneri L2]
MIGHSCIKAIVEARNDFKKNITLLVPNIQVAKIFFVYLNNFYNHKYL